MTEPIRAFALRYPEARDGVSCARTALEKRTVNARNKAFVFLGAADVMMKLGDSLAEAAERAGREPGRYKVGAHGWVTVGLDADPPPRALLERWVDESYRLVAGKQLVAQLPPPR
jgi:predicted DNA-binding protein (MmcQ/YjbR family)